MICYRNLDDFWVLGDPIELGQVNIYTMSLRDKKKQVSMQGARERVNEGAAIFKNSSKIIANCMSTEKGVAVVRQ